MQERRKYVRTNGLVLVNYKVPDLEIEGKSSAFDVSGAGLRITLDKRLKIGAAIEMELYLPGDSQPIFAKGKTVWIEKCKDKTATKIAPQKEYFYVGVAFILIDENDKNKIINYIQRRLHQAKEKI